MWRRMAVCSCSSNVLSARNSSRVPDHSLHSWSEVSGMANSVTRALTDAFRCSTVAVDICSSSLHLWPPFAPAAFVFSGRVLLRPRHSESCERLHVRDEELRPDHVDVLRLIPA